MEVNCTFFNIRTHYGPNYIMTTLCDLFSDEPVTFNDISCCTLFYNKGVNRTNSCSPSPCANSGQCTLLVKKFLCICTDKYEGETCQTSKRELVISIIGGLSGVWSNEGELARNSGGGYYISVQSSYVALILTGSNKTKFQATTTNNEISSSTIWYCSTDNTDNTWKNVNFTATLPNWSQSTINGIWKVCIPVANYCVCRASF